MAERDQDSDGTMNDDGEMAEYESISDDKQRERKYGPVLFGSEKNTK